MSTKRRKPGRPQKPALAKETVFEAALSLLEHKGVDGVTMRALATKLKVDPMTLYWHFASKDALLREAAAWRVASLKVRHAPGRWPKRVVALGLAYGKFLDQSGGLARYIALVDAAAFDPLFREAIGEQKLTDTARDALLNLIHGHALGGVGGSLENELELLVSGMERTVSR
jgi:AcrR family transcriptional regulator